MCMCDDVHVGMATGLQLVVEVEPSGHGDTTCMYTCRWRCTCME